MKYLKVSFNQADIIDNFASEFSSLEVLNYNDAELKVSIKDRVRQEQTDQMVVQL